jgi:2-polyprenyl-3-methyl-5-hydroxy-6-metoxy-1,4-benzoquinol methylase
MGNSTETTKKCYLCGNNDFSIRPGRVRDINALDVLECSQCGLVFLSSFDHINDDFYIESGMLNGKVDIESYRNNTYKDDLRRYLLVEDIILNKSILDFGCGAGGFLAKASERAIAASGIELDQVLRERLNTENIPCYKDLDEVNGTFDVITLFHVLEHLPDPVEMLKQLSRKLTLNGQVIIEVPNANDALLTLYKSAPFSEFTYWSCHLYLFNQENLAHVAKKSGLKVNFIKQIQRYPLSNHLFWLANDKPGGHQKWNFIDSAELNASYEKQLASIGKCDTLYASFSLI